MQRGKNDYSSWLESIIFEKIFGNSLFFSDKIKRFWCYSFFSRTFSPILRIRGSLILVLYIRMSQYLSEGQGILELIWVMIGSSFPWRKIRYDGYAHIYNRFVWTTSQTLDCYYLQKSVQCRFCAGRILNIKNTD